MSLSNEISFNLGLPATPITTDNELFMELNRVYAAIRAVAYRLDSTTGGLSPEGSLWTEVGSGNLTAANPKFYMEAAVDLTYGNTIQISSAGLAEKGTDGKVVGFCSVPGGVLTGEVTEVTVIGMYPAFPPTTLTPGVFYVQSGSAGQVGNVGTQKLGFAVSDTQLYFMPQL